MSKKKIILSVIAIAVAGAGLYAYKEYNRKLKDLSHVDPQVEIAASELIQSFEKNEAAANASYLDKVIAVSGAVRSVEKNERGYYTVILGDANSMSAVRCSMDSVHQLDAMSLAEGRKVTMKGACTGFNSDELLGSDVILNRCVLDK